ncbi:hypothetical protein [Arthrobacter sp. H14]|uniref:hypothetical protein n=1 Tax=Arthrobacter sp. H14 TaxID=1312959 RepID=UPI00047E12AE|nr:hypothetical protein [Arthrobacter sp. H14]
MQNIFTKSLAVTTVSGLMLVGGAGMASADTTDTNIDGATTEVSDNRVDDSGNLSLGNILNDTVDTGDIASNNNVLSGIDADVSDNLNGIASGNDADVDANPDVDSNVDADSDAGSNVDADASAESTNVSSTDSGYDNEGLLGGLL